MPPDLTPERYRFFVLTCRDPRHDFRLPLVQALRQRTEAYSIWLRRTPLISGPRSDDPEREISIPALLRFIRAVPRHDRVNVFLDSTNTYFPAFGLALRAIAPPSVWCFDLHDDLRYHNTGLKRWREGRIVAALCRTSDAVVHAAPSLTELFPRSQHLGNASHLGPLDLSQASWDDILVIASFDERLDFSFLADLAAASPELRFHLHGWTRPGDTTTQAHIRRLTETHPNVQYHGAYTMDELPGILRRYRISVAPYRADDPLTRYIDPLRFYHCLNAGLEMVSTAIPQARYMRSCIHVVTDPAACRDTLAAIRARSALKQPVYAPITWEQRASRLIE
ncbi:MAG TPA: hypothetical protein VE690_20235, partial [Rhodopila sp.]|nr:hypothetical protein [Rhodopila sp.]